MTQPYQEAEFYVMPCTEDNPQHCEHVEELVQEMPGVVRVITDETFAEWGAEITEAEEQAASTIAAVNAAAQKMQIGTWAYVKALANYAGMCSVRVVQSTAYEYKLLSKAPVPCRDFETYQEYYATYEKKAEIEQAFVTVEGSLMDLAKACFVGGVGPGAMAAMCEITYGFAKDHGIDL